MIKCQTKKELKFNQVNDDFYKFIKKNIVSQQQKNFKYKVE